MEVKNNNNNNIVIIIISTSRNQSFPFCLGEAKVKLFKILKNTSISQALFQIFNFLKSN